MNDKRIEDLVLTTRSSHCLLNRGYSFASEVAAAKDWELLQIPNFGRKSLKEVRDLLKVDEQKAAPKNLREELNFLRDCLLDHNQTIDKLVNALAEAKRDMKLAQENRDYWREQAISHRVEVAESHPGHLPTFDHNLEVAKQEWDGPFYHPVMQTWFMSPEQYATALDCAGLRISKDINWGMVWVNDTTLPKEPA